MAAYNGKYRKLADYLLTKKKDGASLTFAEIEKIMGEPLPQSAHDHHAWWANQPTGQSQAWVRAGFRTSALSLDEKRVSFVRATESPGVGKRSMDLKPLVDDAKERLAAALGLDPNQVEITIRF